MSRVCAPLHLTYQSQLHLPVEKQKANPAEKREERVRDHYIYLLFARWNVFKLKISACVCPTEKKPMGQPTRKESKMEWFRVLVCFCQKIDFFKKSPKKHQRNKRAQKRALE